MAAGVSGSFKWMVVKRRAFRRPSVDPAPPAGKFFNAVMHPRMLMGDRLEKAPGVWR